MRNDVESSLFCPAHDGMGSQCDHPKTDEERAAPYGVKAYASNRTGPCCRTRLRRDLRPAPSGPFGRDAPTRSSPRG